MFERNMFNKESFKNVEKDGVLIGFQFDCKAQYYRGFTLSILRDIKVTVDDIIYDRETIRFTLEGDTFTLDEMETVITYRWKFGQYATVTVLKEGGLTKGSHHIQTTQVIAPSYMPSILVHTGECDFRI